MTEAILHRLRTLPRFCLHFAVAYGLCVWLASGAVLAFVVAVLLLRALRQRLLASSQPPQRTDTGSFPVIGVCPSRARAAARWLTSCPPQASR